MKKRLEGKVISDKQQKTRIIDVERIVQHKLYKKYIRRHTHLPCHDPLDVAKLGDKVIIEETRPLSRTKHWRIVKVIK